MTRKPTMRNFTRKSEEIKENLQNHVQIDLRIMKPAVKWNAYTPVSRLKYTYATGTSVYISSRQLFQAPVFTPFRGFFA